MGLEPIDFWVNAHNLRDALDGARFRVNDLYETVFDGLQKGTDIQIKINNSLLTHTDQLTQPFNYEDDTEIEVTSVVQLSGKIGSIFLGIGLGVLSISGIGLLGLSATSLGLLGASLVFSSFFNTPKADLTKEPEKRSVAFSGTLNVVGGSNPTPLLFGMNVYCGTVVISADITPTARSVV